MASEETETCEVKNCNNEVKRSIPTKNLLKNLPNIKLVNDQKKRTHICKEHYKEFKKATREERKLNSLGR